METTTLFIDAHKRECDTPHFCYRSGITVYEEGFDKTLFAARGWNGAGFPLNILEDFPTYLSAENTPNAEVLAVEINGVSLRHHWEYLSYEKKTEANGSLLVTVTLKNLLAPIKVRLYTRLDGTAILTRWFEIDNESDAPMNLGRITVMGGAMDVTKEWRRYVDEADKEKIYSVGFFEFTHWGHEGAFRFHDIGAARMTVGGNYDRSRFRHPMFILRNNVLGTIWFGQLAYSGAYAFDFDVNLDNAGNAYLSFCARIDGDSPSYVLAPHATYATPAMHLGMMNGELDDIVNEMHDHTRRSVFTLPERSEALGGLIEGGMGPERVMDERACRHFIDTFAAVGAETFIIDAGWYCPAGEEAHGWKKYLGDWELDPGKYPNGIDGIREYAHSKGLLFGMWAEIEAAGENSRLAKEHPEWFIRRDNGDPSLLLDMAIPEACAFAESVVERMINEYKIDVFRLDRNAEIHFTNRYGEREKCRYFENLYAMFRRLREKYPSVIFENCASGGGRTDLGMVANFTHTWVSDIQVAPRAMQITNGMTMVLPPERVDRLASGMSSHTTASLDLVVRHTLFGRPTTNDYNAVGTEANPNQLAFVRHCYDIYKEIIRPFAPTGRIYHHTPELYDYETKGTMILERAARDRSAGVIGIFRLVGTNGDETTVRPRGIDLGATYAVTFDNTGAVVTLSGFEMQRGLSVRIGQNLSSELIIYRKLDT